MLNNSRIIGFAPTKDAAKAKDFYVGRLGMEFVSEDGYALVLNANGNMLRVIKAGDFKPVHYTVLGWEVKNIESVVAGLKSAGVSFEQYPFIQNKESSVWNAPNGDKIAWFKDPDGNVLSISEHV